MTDTPFVAVVGGVNADITGTSSTAYLPGESNPGIIHITPGGVGRNIAENLTRLGWKVQLFTLFGQDERGMLLENACHEIGIGLDYALRMPEAATSSYLCINDEHGEMVAAVSDMAIYDRLTPEMTAGWVPKLNRAQLVIVDANIPGEVITYLAETLTVPVFADPVSVKKSGRLLNALPHLAALKPNRAEAAWLAGLPENSDPVLAARRLTEMGVGRVMVSMGATGVLYDDGKESGILAPVPHEVINTTGCGDAFLSGAAHAWLMGKKLEDMVRYGNAAAAVCSVSAFSVSPEMSREALKQFMD